jgi:nucleotide-binding universal stress UspA family protein
MLAVLRYRHVLVAYDGSPDADLALEHAVGLSQAFRARLALVAVVPPAPAFAWQAPGGVRASHTPASRAPNRETSPKSRRAPASPDTPGSTPPSGRSPRFDGASRTAITRRGPGPRAAGG